MDEASLIGGCVNVHLMSPEEEDRDSLLVSVLRLADLKRHAEVLHRISQKYTTVFVCVCVCVCVCTYPCRPVREALHLGEHQVSWFVVVSCFLGHPAASELDHSEGIKLS